MTKHITITIDTDNAAFMDGNEGPEVARILHRLATVCEDGVGWFRLALRDSNGNTVGFVDIEER